MRCNQCGAENPTRKVTLKRFEVTVCESCYKKIESSKEKTYREMKEVIADGRY